MIAFAALMSCAGGRQNIPSNLRQKDSQIRQIRKSLEERPGDYNLHFDLAKLLVEENKFSEAITHLESVLAIKSDHLESRLLKGVLQYQQGDIPQAYEEFITLLNIDSSAAWVDRVGNAVGMRYPVNQVTRGSFDNAQPSYDFDGNRIVFQSNRYQNWDLFILDRSSRRVSQLTSNPLHDESPVFLSDSKILFTRQQSSRSQKRDIYSFDLGERREESVVTHPADDWYPSPAPVENTLLFVSDREIDGNYQSKILKYDFAADQVQPLLLRELDYGSPCVGSNGSKVLFTARNEQHYALFGSSLDGTKVSRLTYKDMDFGAPRYSPDGTKIAFFSKSQGNFDIYELDLTTEKLVRLTVSGARDLSPVYSPDGTKIAFYSDRTGNYQIYEIDLSRPFSKDELINQFRGVVADNGMD